MEHLPHNAPLSAIHRSTPLFLSRLLLAMLLMELVPLVWSWQSSAISYTDAVRMQLQGASGPILIAIILLQIIVFIAMASAWNNEYYVILPTEILHRRGTIVRKQQLYPYGSIQSLATYRSFRGRIFNYGTITLIMPSMQKEVRLYEIPDPEQFVEAVKTMVASAQMQQVNQQQAGRAVAQQPTVPPSTPAP